MTEAPDGPSDFNIKEPPHQAHHHARSAIIPANFASGFENNTATRSSGHHELFTSAQNAREVAPLHYFYSRLFLQSRAQDRDLPIYHRPARATDRRPPLNARLEVEYIVHVVFKLVVEALEVLNR